MKMKLRDRFLLLLTALLLLASSACLCALAIKPELSQWIMGVPFFSVKRLCVLAAGILMLLAFVYVLIFPRKLRYNKHAFVIQQTENGEVRISIKAIENLVQKCIDTHNEIHVEKMLVRAERESVVIDLRLSLANNISIPLAVSSLQKQIKQYLQMSSGIEVREVRVSVETADGSGVGESPYLVENQMTEKADKPKENEKKAIHQRIFAPEEQPNVVPVKPVTPEEKKQEENDRITEELFAEEPDAQESELQIPQEAAAPEQEDEKQ